MTDVQAPAAGEALPAPTRMEDLKPKMRLAGTVKKIELFGAFIDVGVGRDGLVHISALRPERVNNVADVVKEGESVTVWVRKVDPGNGRLDLTMIEPLAVEWNELKSGQIYAGKVTKTEKFGAFVDIGAERPGLVHISEMATYRVEDVSEVVKAGSEVRVKVLAVDSRKKQIKLSIKAAELAELAQEPEEVEDIGEELTAMQLAFRKAQQKAGPGALRLDERRGRPQSQRRVQEDLLQRTLANKRK
ncbi:MAG: S1 RNA-binding domain-containing protein [Anaerolineales bacterium]|nr:S1 RNA-binding domain-containing protein [Anaerolineales bacterium]